MAALSRRGFLSSCAVGVGIGAISANLPINWDDIRRAASETPLTPGSSIVVLVTLYGGNDGINTLIPYAQDAYFDARPELAYSGEEVIDLDGEYGLNPGMKGLGQMFHDGSLAIIRGVGYPDQDRSHFRSMDIWQTGSLDSDVSTGWIGRWLDLGDRNPMRAVNVGTVLPMLAIGSQMTAATLPPESLAAREDQLTLISSLGEPGAGDAGLIPTVRESYRAAVKASSEFDELYKDSNGASESNEFANDNSLQSQLDVVSQCIRAGLPTQVYCVSLGGFDTHSNEKSTQQELLRSVDTALSRFLKAMSTHENGRNVVLMAYSEFGRRVKANASDGTDHGTSGPVFIAGTPVQGGFYGDAPSLTDLAQGDLKTTTDFRDIYAEIISTALGVDPVPIVGARKRSIGFLA